MGCKNRWDSRTQDNSIHFRNQQPSKCLITNPFAGSPRHDNNSGNPKPTNLDEIPRSNSESIPYFLSVIAKYTQKYVWVSSWYKYKSHFQVTQNGIPHGNLSGAKETAKKLFIPQTANERPSTLQFGLYWRTHRESCIQELGWYCTGRGSRETEAMCEAQNTSLQN